MQYLPGAAPSKFKILRGLLRALRKRAGRLSMTPEEASK